MRDIPIVPLEVYCHPAPKPTPLYTGASDRSHEVITMSRGRPHKCPYENCGSTDTVSKGARVTKSLGIRKIRRCKSCGRKFTPKNQKPIEPSIAEAETEQTIDPINPALPEVEEPSLSDSEDIVL